MQYLIFEDGSEFLIDCDIRVKLNNPLFNEQSTYSYPFTIAYTQELKEKLSYRHNPAITDNKKFKQNASLRLGNLTLKGLFVVNSINGNQLDCHFSGQNGYVYHASNTMLSDVFKDISIPITFADLKDTLINPDNHDFIFAPVKNNDFVSGMEFEYPYNGVINDYSIKNNDLNPYSESPKIPFFKLSYLVKKVFDYMNIELINNPLESPEHKFKYLINNFNIADYNFSDYLEIQLLSNESYSIPNSPGYYAAKASTGIKHGMEAGSKFDFGYLYRVGILIGSINSLELQVFEVIDDYTLIIGLPYIIHNGYPDGFPAIGSLFAYNYTYRVRKFTDLKLYSVADYIYSGENLIITCVAELPADFQGTYYCELAAGSSNWNGRIIKLNVSGDTITIPRDSEFDIVESAFYSSDYYIRHFIFTRKWIIASTTLSSIAVSNHVPDMTCFDFIESVESTLIGKFIANDTLSTATFVYFNDITKYKRAITIEGCNFNKLYSDGNNYSSVKFEFASSPDNYFNENMVAETDNLTGLAKLGHFKLDALSHLYYEFSYVFLKAWWKVAGSYLKSITTSDSDNLDVYIHTINMPPVLSDQVTLTEGSIIRTVQIMRASFSGSGAYENNSKLTPAYFRFDGMANTYDMYSFPLISAFCFTHKGIIDASKLDLCLEGSRGIVATYAAKYIDWFLHRRKPYTAKIIWPYHLLNNFDYSVPYMMDGVKYMVDSIDFVRRSDGRITFGDTTLFKI